MKLMWQRYGVPEIPYTIRDLQAALADYTGLEFANTFFSRYIYDSQMPDYEQLLASVGVAFKEANPDVASLGTPIEVENGRGILQSNAIIGSPIYEAGIEQGDSIISIGGRSLNDAESIESALAGFEPGEVVEIEFERLGEQMTVQAELMEDPVFTTQMNSDADARSVERREKWLMQ
jgi:predicted metalloprotease with PDZ domain